MIKSRHDISNTLRLHQKRLQMGDRLLAMKELAERAGLHRDTLYAAINGDRISEISQIRLSRMLDKLAEEPSAPSRVMHVRLGPQGPSLGFGIGVGALKK